MQAGYLYGLNLCILTAKYRLGVSDTICCDTLSYSMILTSVLWYQDIDTVSFGPSSGWMHADLLLDMNDVLYSGADFAVATPYMFVMVCFQLGSSQWIYKGQTKWMSI